MTGVRARYIIDLLDSVRRRGEARDAYSERQVVDSNDSMGSFAPYVDTSGYDKEKFYVRSKDTKGHDKFLRHGNGPKDVIAVPPELHAMFFELKAAFVDYRTNADVMRDALVHLCHLRAEQVKNPSLNMLNALHKVHVRVELERLEAEWQAEAAELDRINSLYKAARNDRQKRFLEDIIREFLVTCEDEDTRQTLETMLRRL